MTQKLVYQNGETIRFRFFHDGPTASLVIAPFADDDEERESFFAAVCPLFLAGHTDTKELCIELIVHRHDTDEDVTYTLTEALDRLGPAMWLPFCVVVAAAAHAMLNTLKLSSFHLYVAAYGHDSQLNTMLGVVRDRLHEDYSIYKVDTFAGSTLWVGERKTED